MVIARAHPHVAQDGDWRARVLTVALRVLRTQAKGSVAVVGDGDAAEVSALVPASDHEVLGRAAKALSGELRHSLQGFRVTVAHSRLAHDPVDLYRAGKEAVLAANVAEAEESEYSRSRTRAPTGCCCRR